MSLNGINGLSHTKWNCEYHIVFAPKYNILSFIGYLKGKNSSRITEYIQNQLKEDYLGE